MLAADPCYRQLQQFTTLATLLVSLAFLKSSSKNSTLFKTDSVGVSSADRLRASNPHGHSPYEINLLSTARLPWLPTAPLGLPPRGYKQDEELVAWPSRAGAVVYDSRRIRSSGGQ